MSRPLTRACVRVASRMAAAALVAAVAWVPISVAVAQVARAEAAYSAVVSAQNLHVTITNAAGSFPVVPQVDGGLGTAQAALDNNGGSSAYAANPDPGFIGTLPALAGSIVPVPLPVPFPSVDIPVVAATSNGQPPKSVGTGPYQLHVEANENDARATSLVGATADGTSAAPMTTARARVVQADGTVTGVATSDTSVLTVLGLVTVAQVHAEAKVVRDPRGGITRSSDLAIGRITVAGVSVGYANGKLTAAGTEAPVSLSMLNDLLRTASQGRVSLSETERKDTPNGVVSSALNITQLVPAPPGGCVTLPVDLPVLGGVKYCGETKIVYTLGGAVADVFYQVFPTGSLAPEGPEPPGAVVVPPADGETLPDAPPVTGIGSGPEVVPPALAEGGSGPGPSRNPVFRLAGVLTAQRGFANVYLALVAAGVLGTGAVTAVRVLGVRNAWDA